MNISEIQTYYEKEKFEELLKKLQGTFDEIDIVSVTFKETLDGHTCTDIISQLTGHFMYLNMVLSIAESELKNEEARFYNERKIELESSGQKFIANSVEKEAAEFVRDYRRIRNIVEAYTINCRTGISTCQSILKSISEENKV